MANSRTEYATRFEDERDTKRLADIYAPCITLILQLRASSDYGEPELLRRRVKQLLDDARRDAIRYGASEDQQKAQFAIVGFIDETILGSDWEQKDYWVAQPLQLEFYNRYDAGEVFFANLEELRRDPSTHANALEVYYLCMALGFKGQYQLHGREKYRMLIEDTFNELRKVTGVSRSLLSPHGKPRDQVLGEVKSKVPTWLIATMTVVIAAVIYLALYMVIQNNAGDSASALRRIQPYELTD